jgi:hemerythrin-like domain-containing protein
LPVAGGAAAAYRESYETLPGNEDNAMSLQNELSRREVFRMAAAGSLATSGLLLAGSASAQQGAGDSKDSRVANAPAEAGEDAERGENVGATEDLMREHGVLRRTLIAYRESAGRLREQAAQVDAAALAQAAQLFRTFGEQYHERLLEEAYIFPTVRELGSAESRLVDILIEQHRRGSEITEYILSVTRGSRIGSAQAEPLAAALQSMVRMYQSHAAREDTVVFPAWKEALPRERLQELGERFEEIEHQQFGEDGFEDAVQRIARVEDSLGIGDLALFTAPPPPAGA